MINDFDKEACRTLKLNRPNWNVINEPIESLVERNLLEELNIEVGELDLLSGGYPCQSFSYAGKRNGLNDVRGTMFYYFAKAIEHLRPKVFFAENVKGLVSHDSGRTLETMVRVFEELGYKVIYRILNAWEYGVAQKRERLIIIGVRNDLDGNFMFPTRHQYKPVLRDVLQNVPTSLGASYPTKKEKCLN